jgi:hypothetical protein
MGRRESHSGGLPAKNEKILGKHTIRKSPSKRLVNEIGTIFAFVRICLYFPL